MRSRRTGVTLGVLAVTVLALVVAVAPSAFASSKSANVCPNGSVNFGVEPYDSGAKFTAAYQSLTTVLSKSLNCPVNLIITDNYTIEVEAMKAGKIDVGEFGPLGYIFAHTVANAQPIAVFADKHGTGRPTPPLSGSRPTRRSRPSPTSKGHTVAFSDPGSTSGNLLPRYAMIQAGQFSDWKARVSNSVGGRELHRARVRTARRRS